MKLKRLGAVGSAFVVSIASLLTIAFPQIAHASPCSVTSGGGGGGGSGVAAVSSYGPIDSATVKTGFSLTPISALNSGATGFYGSAIFANTDCSNPSVNANFVLSPNGQLTLSIYDNNHSSSSYTQGSAFSNGAAGVTWSNPYNGDAQIVYGANALATNTADIVSIDLSSAGWASIYLKQGSGSDTLLGKMVLPSGVTKFLTLNGIGGSIYLDNTDPSWNSCSNISTTSEAQVQLLQDGVATTLTDTPNYNCSTQDQSSFNSSTNTMDLKLVSASSVSNVDATVTLGTPSETGAFLQTLSDFSVSGGYFNDNLAPSYSATQNVAIAETFTTAVNGYTPPSNGQVELPIAEGVIDMSKGNINLSSAVFGSSLANYSAVAHNLASATTNGQFTLLVPYRSGDKYVGVCPGAASLAAVSSSCPNIYYLSNGQSKNSSSTSSIPNGVTVTASIQTINGAQYWQVSGLTGTGAFSTNVAPTVPGTPNTGFGLTSSPVGLSLLGTVLMASGVYIISRKVKRPIAKRR